MGDQPGMEHGRSARNGTWEISREQIYNKKSGKQVTKIIHLLS